MISPISRPTPSSRIIILGAMLCVFGMLSILASCSTPSNGGATDGAANRQDVDHRPEAAIDSIGNHDVAQTDATRDSTGDDDADQNIDATTDQFPAVGVYTVNLDGTGLELLVNTGARQYSHVRAGTDGDWLTATRYNEDLNGDGVAMEGEGGSTPHYGGTEIIIFRRSDPSKTFEVAGGKEGWLAANSSWTADGKLLFLEQVAEAPIASALKRATFSTLDTATIETLAAPTIEALPVPSSLLLPVDPHQQGPSDSGGTVVFSAAFRHANGWMRPVWKMPASGTATMANVAVVGCPLCPAQSGCCAWDDRSAVLGTNDARIDHSGSQVLWMQQHPDQFFVAQGQKIHVFRQQGRLLSESAQHEVSPAGLPQTTSLSYGQWRPDDKELVYWRIEIDESTGALKMPLYRMNPTGSQRTQVPLPATLCASQPSYLSNAKIIFSAWPCRTAACTCGISAQ